MCVPEILQMLATVQEFKDATKYGPYCDFFFHMKREPEARVSTEGLFLLVPSHLVGERRKPFFSHEPE